MSAEDRVIDTWTRVAECFVSARGAQPRLLRDARQNVLLSGGGSMGFYHVGVIAYLLAALRADAGQTAVHHIHGTSVGALMGVLLALLLARPERSIDEMLDCVYSRLRVETVRARGYIIEAWCTLLREMLPEDIHEICSNRLFVNFWVLDSLLPWRARTEVVSHFVSKEHLIATVHASMSIPFLSIPGPWTTYFCPVRRCALRTMDGVFVPRPRDADVHTLVVNVMRHPYPFAYRLHLCEPSYDAMVLQGLRDADAFLAEQQQQQQPTRHVRQRFDAAAPRTIYYLRPSQETKTNSAMSPRLLVVVVPCTLFALALSHIIS